VSRGSSSHQTEKALSFRERLMQKSSVAASYLDVIAISDEKEKKDKEKKHKKHSEGKKPYSETAE